MQVKSIAECSKGSILQYFRPSLSYNLSATICQQDLCFGYYRVAVLHRFYCIFNQSGSVWILIRWLLHKPADLDSQYFHQKINLGSAGQGCREGNTPSLEVIKLFIRNSTKHEISTAHKTKIPTNKEVSCFKSLSFVFIMLINVKMSTIVV